MALSFILMLYYEVKHLEVGRSMFAEKVKIYIVTIIFIISFCMRGTLDLLISINSQMFDELKAKGGEYNIGW